MNSREPRHELVVDPAVPQLGLVPGEPCHVPWPQGHSTNWSFFGFIAGTAKRGHDRMFVLQNLKHPAGREKKEKLFAA